MKKYSINLRSTLLRKEKKVKKILYKLKQDVVYQEATLYQEVSIPPRTFVRIGRESDYGWWYDIKDVIIQEISEKSNG